jgi:hypothetical protein
MSQFSQHRVLVRQLPLFAARRNPDIILGFTTM